MANKKFGQIEHSLQDSERAPSITCTKFQIDRLERYSKFKVAGVSLWWVRGVATGHIFDSHNFQNLLTNFYFNVIDLM